MGFIKKRKERSSEFVSIRNFLDGISQLEGAALSDVAGELLFQLQQSEEEEPIFVRQDNLTLATYSADKRIMDRLLRHVANVGGYDPGWDGGIHEIEFDAYGWGRSDLTFFWSVTLGQSVEPPCLDLDRKPVPKRLSWFQAYENRVRLSLDEAICLLLGIDPEDELPFGSNGEDEEGKRHYGRWKKALIDAMGDGPWELDPSTWGMNQCAEQTMLHSGIKAWARDTGAPWPFLDDTKAPAPESPEGRAMARELKAAKARVTELEQELQAARQMGSDTPQPTRLMALAVEVQRRYWGSNWIPADPNTKTTQETIVDWLRSNYQDLSNAQAQAVEKVACPFDRNPAKRA